MNRYACLGCEYRWLGPDYYLWRLPFDTNFQPDGVRWRSSGFRGGRAA